MNAVIDWYVRNKDYIDFVKDIVFAIGAVLTFVAFYQFIKLVVQRKTLNKRQEMENDLRMYEEIRGKLKEYVDDYDATQKKMRDIGIRLLHI